MTFSAGRRRVASPFAQRAAEHAKAQETTETADNSDNSDPVEPELEAEAVKAPEIVEEASEPSVESNNQEDANDASDEAQEPTSETEVSEAPAEAADKPTRGRGRPRPAEVKERDDSVLEVVTTSPGRTRNELEDELKLSANEVYMSLYRLRTQGKIERRREGGDHKWYPKPTQ